MVRIIFAVIAACGLACAWPLYARANWPMFGGTPARNMVNLQDKNIPTDWCVDKPMRNVKWSATLGTYCLGGPVVAGGRVFVGTNNGRPRDPNFKSDAPAYQNNCGLMCFRESDGAFLWQTVHDVPKKEGGVLRMGLKEGGVLRMGLLSTPTVVGNRLYYVLPHAMVICADVADGKTVWQYDMGKELKVAPYHGFCNFLNCNNSPLVVGDLVYLVTGNGIDWDTDKVEQPQAPSFIALNKDSGKLAWQSNLPGDKVTGGQWSNPAYAVIEGKPQVIFAGGDAVIYSFEPLTGKLIWKFHSHSEDMTEFGPRQLAVVGRPSPIARSFVATPVIHDNKVYIGLGGETHHPFAPRSAFFLCIDATRTGNVSPGNALPARLALNVNSAMMWCFGGSIEPRLGKGRRIVFGPTVSTCVVHDGLVYIPESNGYMHCLDARTGKREWTYDFKVGITGSPCYVDGKIYVGTEDGEIVIFQAGKQLSIINKIDMGDEIHRAPVAANGVLFVATRGHLYAIAGK